MKKFIKLMAVAMLAIMLVLTFASCAPANSDKAKEKMEKADYTVIVTTFKEATDKGAVATLVATKNGGNALETLVTSDKLTATLYDSAKNAKAAFNETKDAEGKTECQLIGKWVVLGSDEAIKAFK